MHNRQYLVLKFSDLDIFLYLDFQNLIKYHCFLFLQSHYRIIPPVLKKVERFYFD